MGKVIGIDLGTTNSCVAVMEGGEPTVIANAEGMRTTPSVVAFTKEGERLVGSVAKRQAATNVDRTISSIKRQMGTNYRVKIDGKNYSPQEISAMILGKLKKDAESYLGQTVTEAVITVPAYFNDAQRQATKDAGKIAGLNVLRIINEPTSAVSLIEIGDNLIEVLATAGDNHLGGDDFDERLANYIVDQYRSENGVNLAKDPVAMQRIREAAEDAKKALSSQSTANINLPFISTVRGNPVHLEMEITRARFTELIQDLIDRTEGPVRNVLADAGMSPSELGMVLLVGGSTRIPAVQDKVRQLTGKEPSMNLNPDECVAIGAAVQGGKLGGEITSGTASEIILMDVTPLTLSIETVGGVATKIIGRNTTIPARHSQIFSTAAHNQTTVEINVLQGERPFARDNTLLGKFRLSGIRRAPAGVPQIEVTFDIDANGIVKVSAKDLGTGKSNEITISATSNLSDADIEKAINDAREYAQSDGLRKERLDVLSEANRACMKAEQYIRDNKKTMDKFLRKTIQNDAAYLQKLLRGKKVDKMSDADTEAIRSQTALVNSHLPQDNSSMS